MSIFKFFPSDCVSLCLYLIFSLIAKCYISIKCWFCCELEPLYQFYDGYVTSSTPLPSEPGTVNKFKIILANYVFFFFVEIKEKRKEKKNDFLLWFIHKSAGNIVPSPYFFFHSQIFFFIWNSIKKSPYSIQQYLKIYAPKP